MTSTADTKHLHDDEDLDDLDDVLEGLATTPAAAPAPAAKPAAAHATVADVADEVDFDEDAFVRELAKGMEDLMGDVASGAGGDADDDDESAMHRAMEEMLRAMEGGNAASGSAPAKQPTVPAADVKSFQDRIKQTMSKLEESDATASASQTTPGAGGEDMDSLVAEMMKQMESLTESGEFESVLEGMMESLLSKDLLQEPLRDLADKYPAYLAANKDTLTPEEMRKYTKQQDLIAQILAVYEAGEDEQPEGAKKVVALMTEIQELGQPPAELLRELAGGAELGADGGEDGVPPDCNVM
ncbi:Peroxisome chaperone and import receptor [Blastocladiella emersonii ATCC 22665]|nr:Peroxisome chaperone and import receptor [Blastocladiella emersonii ATCC 22665]